LDRTSFSRNRGDAGIVLELQGVDYECLDTTTIDAFTKRLESALGCSMKAIASINSSSNGIARPIPHTFCGKAVVDSAIRDRVAYFTAKSDICFLFPSTWWSCAPRFPPAGRLPAAFSSSARIHGARSLSFALISPPKLPSASTTCS